MKKCCDTCIRMIGWVNMTPGLEFQGHADCGGNDTVSKLFAECLETVIFSMKSRRSWVEVSFCIRHMQLWVLVIEEMEIIMTVGMMVMLKKMRMTMPALLANRCNGQVRSGPVETF